MATSRASILSGLIAACVLAPPLGAQAATSKAAPSLAPYQRCTNTYRFKIGVRLLAAADAQMRAANYRLARDLLDGGYVAVEDQLFDARQAKDTLGLDDSLNVVSVAANAKYAHNPHRDTLVQRALLVDAIAQCKEEDRTPAQPARSR
jgi:hypothetical protein